MNIKYMIFLFPICKNKWTEVDKIIKEKNIIILKEKNISLTDIGKFNLIKNLYTNEHWLGNKKNKYEGLYYKLNSCFPNNENECKIYSIETNNENIKSIKREIRDLCKIGNHSIHTTDFEEEYNFLSKNYFNENTIKFLNIIDSVNSRNFNYYFKKFTNYISYNNLKKEKICISGSSVLSIFNLRDCYDIDFLCIDKNIKYIDERIEIYNNYYLQSKFYKSKKLTIDQIFNNEKYYFYFKNIKIMSLELIKEFKLYRNEEKDKKDIILIERIINDENYRC